MSPFVSRNCLRTSSIILLAARLTALMVSALNQNASMPPTSTPIITLGTRMSTVSRPAVLA